MIDEKLNPTIDADTILGLISEYGRLCAYAEIDYPDKAAQAEHRSEAGKVYLLLARLIRCCAECGTPRYQMCSHYSGYAAELERLDPARDVVLPSQAEVATAALTPDSPVLDELHRLEIAELGEPTPELDAHVAEIFGENHQVKPAEPIRFEPATVAGILGAIAENEAAYDAQNPVRVSDERVNQTIATCDGCGTNFEVPEPGIVPAHFCEDVPS